MFIKKQEVSVLLSKLGIKTYLVKMSILSDIFFNGLIKYKTNEVTNNFC